MPHAHGGVLRIVEQVQFLQPRGGVLGVFRAFALFFSRSVSSLTDMARADDAQRPLPAARALEAARSASSSGLVSSSAAQVKIRHDGVSVAHLLAGVKPRQKAAPARSV